MPEGDVFRKVKMTPELMESWATRDRDGNRLIFEWGEPDDEGFYTPIIHIDYEDNIVNRYAADQLQKLR
jgi:hypothetical protein